jgi:hypothetical protein
VLLLLLAFLQQFQNIAGFGNLGEIDLRFNFRLASPLLDRRRGRRRKMSADFLGLVILEGAGVGLLLGNSDFVQHVENGFAFYLKLSGQIIDSNLHSFSQIPPRLFTRSYRPHGFHFGV